MLSRSCIGLPSPTYVQLSSVVGLAFHSQFGDFLLDLAGSTLYTADLAQDELNVDVIKSPAALLDGKTAVCFLQTVSTHIGQLHFSHMYLRPLQAAHTLSLWPHSLAWSPWS